MSDAEEELVSDVAELVPLAQLELMHQQTRLHVRLCLPGNGYIEEKELESFFKELEMSWRGADVVSLGSRNALTHADHPGFTSILASFSGPLKPCVEREGEGLCAEV